MKRLKSVFSEIYVNNAWCSRESRSGGGSELARTEEIRGQLVSLLQMYKVHSILDAGCGDWNWMSKLDLSQYEVYACDIVPELISENEKKYARMAEFFTADLTKDELPQVDLIICRATLFHLSFRHALQAIENMKRSAKYLLLTTHTHVIQNVDIQDGEWRRLNMELKPFKLGACEFMFYDGPGNDGSIGFWRCE